VPSILLLLEQLVQQRMSQVNIMNRKTSAKSRSSIMLITVLRTSRIKFHFRIAIVHAGRLHFLVASYRYRIAIALVCVEVSTGILFPFRRTIDTDSEFSIDGLASRKL
jgi:Mg-chelatase subunit ChlD